MSRDVLFHESGKQHGTPSGVHYPARVLLIYQPLASIKRFRFRKAFHADNNRSDTAHVRSVAMSIPSDRRSGNVRQRHDREFPHPDTRTGKDRRADAREIRRLERQRHCNGSDNGIFPKNVVARSTRSGILEPT